MDTYNIYVKIFAPPIPPSPRPVHVCEIFVAGAQSQNVSSPDVAGSEQRRHVPRVLPLPASAEMLTNSHTIRPCPLINDPPNIITDGEMRNTRLKCTHSFLLGQFLRHLGNLMMREKLAVIFVSCPGRSADKFYCYFFPHRSNYPSVSRIAPNGMNVCKLNPYNLFLYKHQEALFPDYIYKSTWYLRDDIYMISTYIYSPQWVLPWARYLIIQTWQLNPGQSRLWLLTTRPLITYFTRV